MKQPADAVEVLVIFEHQTLRGVPVQGIMGALFSISLWNLPRKLNLAFLLIKASHGFTASYLNSA